MRKIFDSLTARAVAVTCLVALASVLVTALVAAPIAIRAANGATRDGLHDKTLLAADFVDRRNGAVGQEAFVRTLRAQHIDVYLVRGGKADRGGLPTRFVAAIRAGQSLSGSGLVNGKPMLIEARAFGDAGNGIVLTEQPASGTGWSVLSRLWLPLLAGLLAAACRIGRASRRASRAPASAPASRPASSGSHSRLSTDQIGRAHV